MLVFSPTAAHARRYCGAVRLLPSMARLAIFRVDPWTKAAPFPPGTSMPDFGFRRHRHGCTLLRIDFTELGRCLRSDRCTFLRIDFAELGRCLRSDRCTFLRIDFAELGRCLRSDRCTFLRIDFAELGRCLRSDRCDPAAHRSSSSRGAGQRPSGSRLSRDGTFDPRIPANGWAGTAPLGMGSLLPPRGQPIFLTSWPSHPDFPGAAIPSPAVARRSRAPCPSSGEATGASIGATGRAGITLRAGIAGRVNGVLTLFRHPGNAGGIACPGRRAGILGHMRPLITGSRTALRAPVPALSRDPG